MALVNPRDLGGRSGRGGADETSVICLFHCLEYLYDCFITHVTVVNTVALRLNLVRRGSDCHLKPCTISFALKDINVWTTMQARLRVKNQHRPGLRAPGEEPGPVVVHESTLSFALARGRTGTPPHLPPRSVWAGPASRLPAA